MSIKVKDEYGEILIHSPGQRTAHITGWVCAPLPEDVQSWLGCADPQPVAVVRTWKNQPAVLLMPPQSLSKYLEPNPDATMLAQQAGHIGTLCGPAVLLAGAATEGFRCDDHT